MDDESCLVMDATAVPYIIQERTKMGHAERLERDRGANQFL